jgi:hypothetical protein
LQLGGELIGALLREVVRLGDRRLGPEHLLLAVLRDENAGSVRVLAGLGLSTQAVEDALESRLG